MSNVSDLFFFYSSTCLENPEPSQREVGFIRGKFPCFPLNQCVFFYPWLKIHIPSASPKFLKASNMNLSTWYMMAPPRCASILASESHQPGNGKWGPRIDDVFPIEDGDIPASYVSLPEGNLFHLSFSNFAYVQFVEQYHLKQV